MNNQQPIYLDYNATTPIEKRVAEAMTPYLYEHFGNPSSPHPYGVTAKRAVEKARQQVADMLGCKPVEIFFTSGGTESNNTAIKGIACNCCNNDHIITSSVEHPAVLEPCQVLKQQGIRVSFLPVDQYGQVDTADVKRYISPDTVLVSVMHANNEVGTIQPIAEIAELAHFYGALVHTDAAQSIGKIPVRVDELGVDLLSIAGHKLYAPKGVGALYVRDGVDLEKIMHGAGHERNRRAGTENVLEIVGLGAACEIASTELDSISQHMRQMRDLLWEGLSSQLDNVRLNGHPTERLPNTLSVGFYGMRADDLLYELWDDVAASAGAACHAENVTISTVLEAMKVPVGYAMGTLRFSTGRFTTPEEIEQVVTAIVNAVSRIQDES
ncbi:MAG: cysteine desulfurase [Anaerolineales bacterium]|nr:cysteine desulfurase [Anaerolineales bacterium]